MKKIVLFLCIVLLFSVSCVAQVSRGSDSTAYYKALYLKQLNKPVMTSDQFVRLYKYDRLLKYYAICKKKPSQWKYYKGWSTRVFEE